MAEIIAQNFALTVSYEITIWSCWILLRKPPEPVCGSHQIHLVEATHAEIHPGRATTRHAFGPLPLVAAQAFERSGPTGIVVQKPFPHRQLGQPRRAASINVTSIFVTSIIPSNARFASSPPAAIASVRARGVTCQEMPRLSLHQPQALSSPPFPTMAFQYRSVSAWSSVAIWKENASLCLNAVSRSTRGRGYRRQ